MKYDTYSTNVYELMCSDCEMWRNWNRTYCGRNKFPLRWIMKKQVTEMRTQILREAEDENTEEMTCQTDMCYRISDNDFSGGRGGYEQ